MLSSQEAVSGPLQRERAYVRGGHLREACAGDALWYETGREPTPATLQHSSPARWTYLNTPSLTGSVVWTVSDVTYVFPSPLGKCYHPTWILGKTFNPLCGSQRKVWLAVRPCVKLLTSSAAWTDFVRIEVTNLSDCGVVFYHTWFLLRMTVRWPRSCCSGGFNPRLDEMRPCTWRTGSLCFCSASASASSTRSVLYFLS